MAAWFYMLRLRSGALYVGSTKDIARRYEAHCAGKAGRTTKLDPPVKLLRSEELPSFAEARKREAQVKRWTRAKKDAIGVGDRLALKRLARSHAQDRGASGL